MEILERNSTNFLVLEDGNVESITRTDMNTLLFDHNLWDVLREGTETLTLQEQENGEKLTITPSDDAREFTIDLGDGGKSVYLGEHHKSDLIEALADHYNENKDGTPIRDLAIDVRTTQIVPDEVSQLLAVEPFASSVEEKVGGWLINGHLLLSWECEFHHPDTTSREVTSGTVARGSSDRAYDIDIGRHPQTEREISDVDEFVKKAAWAVTEAPKI